MRVGRDGADVQAVADPVDRLVVEGVHVERASAPVSRCSSEPRATETGWAGSNGRVALVVLEVGAVGEMLVQRAAARHVERLHPAADAEHGKVALCGAGEERQLVLVAGAIDVGAEPRMALLAVDGRGRCPGRR